ncbi:hypothetical protein BsWGS_06798 [Bradybaena similaris]
MASRFAHEHKTYGTIQASSNHVTQQITHRTSDEDILFYCSK